MRRLLLSSLTAMLLAGSARADPYLPTMWLADKADGDTHVVIQGESQTGVIQLWLEVPDEMILIDIETGLRGYDSAFGTDLHFEVQGFNDIVIPDSMLQLSSRGGIQDGDEILDSEVPHGFITDYYYTGMDPDYPWGAQSGLLGPRTVLLDELILRGTGISAGDPDVVYFGFGPSGFELLHQPLPPPGQWVVSQLSDVDVLNGTFSNPFLVETVPEAGALSLLALGWLTVARRRRSPR